MVRGEAAAEGSRGLGRCQQVTYPWDFPAGSALHLPRHTEGKQTKGSCTFLLP